jgi:hypothetical protein
MVLIVDADELSAVDLVPKLCMDLSEMPDTDYTNFKHSER